MEEVAPIDDPRARELSAFLRSRRQRLQPADVGLPAGVRRRTQGLRREEVAMLAGISPTYYVFLEQGRELRPSRRVVAALADALRLDPTERALLSELAHGDAQAVPTMPGEALDPVVLALVDQLDPNPAYVTGRYWDVLAANRAASLLWTDWTALVPQARNMLWWMFTDPKARSVFVEWDKEAMALAARFRAAAVRHPEDPGFHVLAERLQVASAAFRAWWPRFDVAPLGSGVKLLRHASLGEIKLRHTVLQVAANPDSRLVAFQPEDGDRVRIAKLLARRARGVRGVRGAHGEADQGG